MEKGRTKKRVFQAEQHASCIGSHLCVIVTLDEWWKQVGRCGRQKWKCPTNDVDICGSVKLRNYHPQCFSLDMICNS